MSWDEIARTLGVAEQAGDKRALIDAFAHSRRAILEHQLQRTTWPSDGAAICPVVRCREGFLFLGCPNVMANGKDQAEGTYWVRAACTSTQAYSRTELLPCPSMKRPITANSKSRDNARTRIHFRTGE
jgi:hypothetical protein